MKKYQLKISDNFNNAVQCNDNYKANTTTNNGAKWLQLFEATQ